MRNYILHAYTGGAPPARIDDIDIKSECQLQPSIYPKLKSCTGVSSNRSKATLLGYTTSNAAQLIRQKRSNLDEECTFN